MGDDRPDVRMLLDTRGPTLQRAAYLLTGDWGYAEDLLGTTLSHAMPRWGRLGYDDPFLGVLRELVQTWSVWWRRRWPPQPGEEGALAQLTRRQRATAVLVLHVGLPESLAANLMDVSVGTVHGWLDTVACDPLAVAALAELAEDEPPPAPRDRVGAARRETGRRRRRWVAAAGLIAVAVAAGTVASQRSSKPPAPVVKDTRPAWVLPWPDQGSAGLTAPLRDAVTAWALRTGNAGLFAPPVTWFVATSVGGGSDYVVVFEVNGSRGHRLVAGWARRVPATRYTYGFDSPDPWTFYDVPAPLIPAGLDGGSARSPIISFYVPLHRAPGVVSDLVVALTSPVARTVTVDSPSGSVVASLHSGFGTVTLPDPVTGPATVLAAGTPDRQLVGLEGAPTSARPYVTSLRPPALPSDFRVVAQLFDVGPSENDLGPNGLPGGHVRVAVRCRGSSGLTISLNVTRHLIGSAACDGRTHVLVDTASVASARPQELLVRAARSTAYSLVIGIHT